MVDLPIPGNDDSIRSIRLILSYLTDSLITGRAHLPEEPEAPQRTNRGRFPRFRDGRGAWAPAARQTSMSRARFRANPVPLPIRRDATMTEITAAAVKALRDKTDLPMMLCKKALIEAEGDEEKAKEILKREGLKVKEKRADNPTEEGRIFTGSLPMAKRPSWSKSCASRLPSPPARTWPSLGRNSSKRTSRVPARPPPTNCWPKKIPTVPRTRSPSFSTK